MDRTRSIWANMKQRCSNEKRCDYKFYGGRGIKVCKRWDKFENFLSDMGEVPRNNSIDRIDNNKGYNKANCRWIEIGEQNRNKRNNIKIKYKGKEFTARRASEYFNINYVTLLSRLRNGWNIKDALEIKADFSNSHYLRNKKINAR